MSKRIQYRYHIITVTSDGHLKASISGVTVGSIAESVFAKTTEEAIAQRADAKGVSQKQSKKLIKT